MRIRLVYGPAPNYLNKVTSIEIDVADAISLEDAQLKAERVIFATPLLSQHHMKWQCMSATVVIEVGRRADED